jgi:hypothetical protein
LSGSEALLLTRSLAGCTIDTHESRFRKRQVFDGDVLAFRMTAQFQTLVEGDNQPLGVTARCASEKANHREPRLLRSRSKRPHERRAAMNSRRLIGASSPPA